MNEMLLPERRLLSAQAVRVTFRDVQPDRPKRNRPKRDPTKQDQAASMMVRQPRHTTVMTEAVEADALLISPVASLPAADDGALTVVWLPTGGTAQGDLEKTAERWIGQATHGTAPIRASIRTNAIVWAPSRAVVHAHPDQWQDALDAVIRFTLIARHTTTLEKEMQAVWPELDRHAGLSHAVKLRHQWRQPAINRITATVTRMRLSLLHIQTALEQLDPNLSAGSKRLCAELILQAGIYDRLEVLEEPIQFALDHCELANTRLIDHKTASIEIILTALITIALLIQTFIIFQDLPK